MVCNEKFKSYELSPFFTRFKPSLRKTQSRTLSQAVHAAAALGPGSARRVGTLQPHRVRPGMVGIHQSIIRPSRLDVALIEVTRPKNLT